MPPTTKPNFLWPWPGECRGRGRDSSLDENLPTQSLTQIQSKFVVIVFNTRHYLSPPQFPTLVLVPATWLCIPGGSSCCCFCCCQCWWLWCLYCWTRHTLIQGKLCSNGRWCLPKNGKIQDQPRPKQEDILNRNIYGGRRPCWGMWWLAGCAGKVVIHFWGRQQCFACETSPWAPIGGGGGWLYTKLLKLFLNEHCTSTHLYHRLLPLPLTGLLLWVKGWLGQFVLFL